jgi:hypothetical protein
MHMLSVIPLTLTALPWKNRLLLGRPLFIAEQRTTVKSTWQIKPLSRKLAFRFSAPSVRTDTFLEIYFGTWSLQINDIQLNHTAVLEEMAVLFSGAYLEEDGKVRWNGHRCGMNKLLSTEYEQTPPSRSDIFTSTVLSHVYCWYTY